MQYPYYGDKNAAAPSAPPSTSYDSVIPVVPATAINGYQTQSFPMNQDSPQNAFMNQFEINERYLSAFHQLQRYHSIIICDDSGSMNDLADPDVDNRTSRWDELKQIIEILIEGHNAFNSSCDIYFINRLHDQNLTNVQSWASVAPMFEAPPAGGTNLISVLSKIQQYQVGVDMGKPILIHILTDGHPTNSSGHEDIQGLENWITRRTFKSKTYISVVLLTDDESVEAAYRRIQRTVNIDISEDIRGETREVKKKHGKRFPFSKGDYVAKILVGCYDKSIHNIDIEGASCNCIIN